MWMRVHREQYTYVYLWCQNRRKGEKESRVARARSHAAKEWKSPFSHSSATLAYSCWTAVIVLLANVCLFWLPAHKYFAWASYDKQTKKKTKYDFRIIVGIFSQIYSMNTTSNFISKRVQRTPRMKSTTQYRIGLLARCNDLCMTPHLLIDINNLVCFGGNEQRHGINAIHHRSNGVRQQARHTEKCRLDTQTSQTFSFCSRQFPQTSN